MKKLVILFSILLFSLSQFGAGQVAKLNGIDIWWEGHGSSTNPPVLMIMGLNSNLKRWPPELIEGLVNQNLYVITYDNRDTGKSTWIAEESSIIKFLKFLPKRIQRLSNL